MVPPTDVNWRKKKGIGCSVVYPFSAKESLIAFDTSALLHIAPDRLTFLVEQQRNVIAIAIDVLTELDGLVKGKRPEVAESARNIRDWINQELDIQLQGSRLPRIRTERREEKTRYHLLAENNDARILLFASFLRDSPDQLLPVIFCTDDKLQSIKAKAEGLNTVNVDGLLTFRRNKHPPKENR